MAWLPKVSREDLRADLMAALTGAIIVLPQGVAFATIAGMPPEYGLYASMVPAIIAALFGSSRHLVSGPTTAASVVLFSSLSLLAVPGTPDYVALALTLTFMVGVLELALGFARLGALGELHLAFGRRRLHRRCGVSHRRQATQALLRRGDG
jgi:SulP family sulfate permease